MGSKEVDKPSKVGKDGKDAKTPAPQEQSSAATGTVNADWTGFQAYSSIPPHGYMASSPQAHPYMWGVQPMMPPYGTPPYVAMYPHSGIYAHPSMPAGSYPFSPFPMPSSNGVVEALGNTHGSVEADGKISEGKEKLPIKRSKESLGSLNMITGKNGEPGKASGTSANGAHSKSAEGGSEGTSEGSEGDSENDSQLNSAEASQNVGATHSFQNGTGKAPHPMVNQTMPIVTMPSGGATGPTTNLNIGMDYWSSTNPNSTVPTLSGKTPVGVGIGISATGSRDVQSHWLQDERELKKQRRKQSNRESARRSRLRKQAECDELAQRAEGIKEENATLRSEVSRLRSEYERLLAQNLSLKERLGESGGQEDGPKQSSQTE